jgi:trans-aconitate methyltransferase
VDQAEEVEELQQAQPGVPGETGTAAAGEPATANPARVYDALLGGKDNYAADRAVAARLAAAKPALLANVRANRAFLGRVVRYLAGEAGIRQFLDIGTGLPGADNTHEVAQRAAPGARVVYVDNDPVVLAHARALLVSATPGTTAYLDADLRKPGTILAQAAGTLDLSQPVAVMLLGVLYMIPDSDQPYDIVARLMEALAPGSYLAISHPASDVDADAAAEAARRYDSMLPTSQTNRTRQQVTRFFDGLQLQEPGVVQLNGWRPGRGDAGPAVEISSWGGLARKP